MWKKKKNDKVSQEIANLRKQYGSSWKKYWKIKRNYPFGKNSRPRVTVVRKESDTYGRVGIS
jgi:hypothetical protein